MALSERKLRTLSQRKAALCGLVAILALLLTMGAGTSFGHAQDGQVSQGAEAQASAAARTITYAYDAAGRLVSANYSSGAGIAYTFDAAGNLVGVSPSGGGYNVYLPLVLR